MKQLNKKFVQRHREELIAGSLGVIISGLSIFVNVSPDFAWLTGTLSAFLALSVGLIKEYVSSEMIRLANEISPLMKKTSKINDTFASLGGKQFEYAQDEFNRFETRLDKILNGSIPLDESQYFIKIIERMKLARKGCSIIATSSLDERRWSDDPRQLNYMEANEVAISNGVVVNRVFIVNKDNLGDPLYKEGLLEISRQLKSDETNAFVVWQNDLPHRHDLVQDWVMFEDDNTEVYHAYQDSVDPSRVSHADLIVGTKQSDIDPRQKYKEDYKKLLAFAIPAELFHEKFSKDNLLQ